jgi:hypothetical protein
VKDVICNNGKYVNASRKVAEEGDWASLVGASIVGEVRASRAWTGASVVAGRTMSSSERL